AIRQNGAIGNAEHEAAIDDALQMNVVLDFLYGGSDHGGEFDLADAKCAPLALPADPAEEKAEQLPGAIKSEAARHDGVAFKMAREEPETGMNVELGLDQPFVEIAALVGNMRDPVDHQH